jgi:NADPH:quinone reductase-like Zn-dependent oxidoreductase
MTEIPDSMSFEEGTVFPMAIATTIVAIRKCLGGPRPNHKNTHGLLICGSSSSVGSICVQLTKTLGFAVFATTSPAHQQYIKSLRAFEVFCYHDPSVVSKIVDQPKQLALLSGLDLTPSTKAQLRKNLPRFY